MSRPRVRFEHGRVVVGRRMPGASLSSPGSAPPPGNAYGRGHGRGIPPAVALLVINSGSAATHHGQPVEDDAMVKIFAQTLTVDTGSITTGPIIPATYTALLVMIVARSTAPGSAALVDLSFNGDTNGAHYQSYRVRGDGTSATSSTTSGNGIRFDAPGANAGGNDYSALTVTIPGYASTAINKSCVLGVAMMTGGVNTFAESQAGLWQSTAAITTVTLAPQAGNLTAGSLLAVYGLT